MDYSIVREALIEAGFEDFSKGPPDIQISGARYWENGQTLYENSLYLFDRENIDSINESFKILVCMTKEVAQAALKCKCDADIIISPDGYSHWLVLEKVWDILRGYESWTQDMLRCALQSESMTAFLSIAAQKLNNPLAVFDQNFRILARSEIRSALPKGTIWDHMKGEQFNMPEYYGVKERSMVARTMRDNVNHDILFHPARDPEHTYYSAQLEINERPAGCIGVADVFSPLTPGQCAVARIIRDMLEDYLKRNLRNLLLEDASKGFWFDLVTGKAVDRETLSEKLAVRGWRFEDGYTTLSFLPKESYCSQIELTTVMNQVLMEYPLSIIAVEGQIITILLRLIDYGNSFKNKVQNLFQNADLCVGFSFDLPNLSYCAAAYRQSVFAAHYAKMHGLVSVSFGTVHSEYVLELLSRHEPVHACCDFRLLQLSRSPKESDRLLVPCLKAYLANGRNIADTARALYLHRNTVIYRIEKLSRLLDVDFDELSEAALFSLLISCFLCLKGHLDG